MKFLEYVNEWKTNCRLNISEGWKICQDQVLRDHITPYLCNRCMSEILPAHISKIMEISRSKGHSANQQKKIYMVLSKLFNDAVNFFEIIHKNPVKKRFHLPHVPSIEREYITPEQSIILLEYVMHDHYGVGVWIQLLTGIRVSELQALEWSDLNFKTKWISVRRSYNKITKKIQGYTKNKTHYRVPIPPKLEKFLTPLRTSGPICLSHGGKMMNERCYDRYLKNVFKKLRLPITSSHGLRHSCARLYKSLGATDDMIQFILGHKSQASTQTYLHKEDDELLEIIKKIA